MLSRLDDMYRNFVPTNLGELEAEVNKMQFQTLQSLHTHVIHNVLLAKIIDFLVGVKTSASILAMKGHLLLRSRLL